VHPWINKALERGRAKVERTTRHPQEPAQVRHVMTTSARSSRTAHRADERRACRRHGARTCATRSWTRSVAKFIPERAYASQWDVNGLSDAVRAQLNLDLPVKQWAAEEGIAEEEIRERIEKASDELMARERPSSAGRDALHRAADPAGKRLIICGASTSRLSIISDR